MSRRANVINRAVLTVLGLLLVAAGGLGLAISLGAFGARSATYPALREDLRTFPDTRPWFWWAVAAILLLIAVLSLLWLLTQFRTDRSTRLDRTTNPSDGYTTVHSSALTDAVESEALAIDGVTGASAHVEKHRGELVALRVELADSSDIGEVRTRLEDEVVAHLREGIGEPQFPVTIELRPSASRTPQRSVI